MPQDGEMQPVDLRWRFVTTGFKGQPTDIGGVSLWDVEWTPTHGRITVVDPQHPSQQHTLFTYEVASADPPLAFAAGEFSNGRWGFFVPETADLGPFDSLIPASIAEWFAERGYMLSIWQLRGTFWADLAADDQVFAPRYGSGSGATEAAESAQRRHIDEQGGAPRRKVVTIHCPSGRPGPPFEVLAVDGHTSLATFDTLAEAEAYAIGEATKVGAEVLLSPLARGLM